MLSKLTDQERSILHDLFDDTLRNKNLRIMVKVLYSNLCRFVEKALKDGKLQDDDLLLIFRLFVHLPSVEKSARSNGILYTLDVIYLSRPYSPKHLEFMRMQIY